MSTDWNQDDLARLLALEHAFCSLALISSGNFAYLANIQPSEAIKKIREAVESSMFDTGAIPKGTQILMHEHLKRIFDHVGSMAVHVDKGVQK